MTETPLRTTDVAALVDSLDAARILGTLPARTDGIAHDSRAVRAGEIFVALRGERIDGHTYLEAARARGAALAVVDEAFARVPSLEPAGLPLAVVPDTRRALGQLARTFFGDPSRALAVVGITGTNGKTTTAHLVAAIFEAAGTPCGLIGTLGATFGSHSRTLANTTPLALELTELLASMRDDGARAVAMEVSSHALALDRVREIAFASAVLTNVTRDHLDFHQNFEAYAAAKRSLFDDVPHAIVCADDARGAAWAHELRALGRAVTTYGLGAGADVRATDVALEARGSAFTVAGMRLSLRLPARFNVRNALAALAVARGAGIDDAVTARALGSFASVPGRMEHFAGGGIDVLVDYAHTPDALDGVLRAARETTMGSLAVVFGCGGDRDRGKRPLMGRVAAMLADRIYVTSDNPRGEAPAAIVRDILVGFGTIENAHVELDRRIAIRTAIAEAEPGDVIVVAGKGHETVQIVGAHAAHFDDREEVRGALALREVAPSA